MTAPLQSPEEVVEWIDACVLGDLRTLVQGIDAYYASPQHVTPDGRPTGAANFLLVAGCCAAIDHLAHIYTGTGTDEAKATAFIGKFLAPINRRYGEVTVLIWKCFRQGTVRRSWPKRIVLEDDAVQVITGVGGEASDPHPAPLPGLAADSFLINGRQLLWDLTLAFGGAFRAWILTDAPAEALVWRMPALCEQLDSFGALVECATRNNSGARVAAWITR